MMIETLLMLLFMSFYALALWGIGQSIWKGLPITVAVAAGIAVFVFVGGLLNLLSLAFGPVLLFGLCLGLLLAGKEIINFDSVQTPHAFNSPRYMWLAATLIALLALLVTSSMWPQTFNFHDDYQKYFIHPFKMLGGGSLFGSPMATLGKEVLGGQALLQAPFIYLFGAKAANVFDAVFCAFLLSIMLVEIAYRSNAPLSGLLAALLLFVINAQYVNISSQYSLALLVSACVYLHYLMLLKPRLIGLRSGLCLMGILYATAISLKSTNGILPVVHFPVVLATLWHASEDRKTDLLTSTVVAALTGLFALSVWILLPVSMWLDYSYSGTSGALDAISPDIFRLEFLFSYKPLFWGGSPALYATLVGAALGSWMVAWWFVRKRENTDGASLLASLAGLVPVSLIVVVLVAGLGDSVLDLPLAIRYSVPFLLGFVPMVIVLSAVSVSDGDNKARWAVTLSLLVCIISWAPDKWQNLQKSEECGSELAFRGLACSENYKKYNEFVLGGAAKEYTELWQSKIPADVPVLVWINFAHLLDFSRNKIVEMDRAGLNNPWAQFPAVEYVMIQTAGYASRSADHVKRRARTAPLFERGLWINSLRFEDYLQSSVAVEAILHRDEQVLIAKIIPPAIRTFK